MPENQALFDPSDFPEVALDKSDTVAPLPYPLWTEHKATLIFRYLYYFVLVTKHGTYIDGFAGPQTDHRKNADKLWSARLVIETMQQNPKSPKLRHFHFVELDKEKIPYLQALKDAEAATANKPARQVMIYPGDFNVEVDQILGAKTIKPKEAAFCLLDQRTFECHWESVRKLAAYKPPGQHKIEIFYFLSIGWLDRSFAATRDDTPIRLWWGRDDWRTVYETKNAAARAAMFTKRFEGELGYRTAKAWPIYKQQGGGAIMYYMIHATDHPEAPKLMRRAYRRAVDPLEPPEQLDLKSLLS